ncbi:hypothetical protein GGS23DRAFT_592850 [Durotheca rogersii]|uniref:uncharacterized protein n=1 Tax=Durotheca rogersii TaxID=419775 RepID=UPI0022209DF6|nr:uncharacterized protein GGS23DRAFT_592850 [Durotheca rogersii]KAI5867543.1 hypothetical protein GGS23DRAFT_592850 [Durotheca rogersii]
MLCTKYMSGTLLEIIQCSPSEKIQNQVYVGALINLVLDIGILALLRWIIQRPQMATTKKLSVSFLFGIGVLPMNFMAPGLSLYLLALPPSYGATACGLAHLVSLVEILHDADAVYYTIDVGR